MVNIKKNGLFSLPLISMSSIEAKFLTLGIWNTLFGLFLFYLLSEQVEVFQNYQISLLITFLVSTTQAHYTQRKFVWKSEGRYFDELLKFGLATLLIYFVNIVLLELFLRNSSLEVFEAQVVCILILTVLSFGIQKRIVFKSFKS